MNKTTRSNLITYLMLIACFIIIQIMAATGHVSSLLRGQLVPICAYIVMAISLNLTVGVLGELSLGHAGFMSAGAFSGVVTAMYLQPVIASASTVRIARSLCNCFFIFSPFCRI